MSVPHKSPVLAGNKGLIEADLIQEVVEMKI